MYSQKANELGDAMEKEDDDGGASEMDKFFLSTAPGVYTDQDKKATGWFIQQSFSLSEGDSLEDVVDANEVGRNVLECSNERYLYLRGASLHSCTTTMRHYTQRPAGYGRGAQEREHGSSLWNVNGTQSKDGQHPLRICKSSHLHTHQTNNGGAQEREEAKT
ncbi:hypothetical protein QFC21_002591, partial [Naganishia friedmannii]